MNLLLLLDMVAAGRGGAVAVEVGDDRLTAADLLAAAWAGAGMLRDASTVAYVGANGLAFPIALFAAAAAGIPLAPLNYRLGHDQLDDLVRRLGHALVIAEPPAGDALAARGHRVVAADTFATAARTGTADISDVPSDGDGAAVLLFTSGTTAAPKAAVLRHRHLMSYVVGTVEFGSADPDDAVLVSVPPYHVAGLANLLSNLYAGRRVVYLRQFDAEAWVRTVRDQRITNAMVVPTMLARIVGVLERGGGLPTLRSLSYGGARTPVGVVRRVMDLLPDVGLTNAYGLTETSSTIAVLGPDDHRAARDGDPDALARLSSAGRVLPTVEVEVRGPDGPVPPGEPGEVWVRGEQVSGEYAGSADTPIDAVRWFPTRDRGWVDDDGYLFIEGRTDDTIIRGGENIAPAEIEDVLLRHPAIAECAVVGVPDEEWGQRIAAVIVPREGADLDLDEVRAFAQRSLRSSKTPELVRVAAALPYTETGKLLRRQVRSDLVGAG